MCLHKVTDMLNILRVVMCIVIRKIKMAKPYAVRFIENIFEGAACCCAVPKHSGGGMASALGCFEVSIAKLVRCSDHATVEIECTL